MAGESFLASKQRLSIIVLQVAITGIIAVGVTQVIITGGVDLSSGSMVGFIAMAASFAQTAANSRAVFLQPEYARFDLDWFIDSNPLWAIGVGLLLGLFLGWINGKIIAKGLRGEDLELKIREQLGKTSS